MSRYDKAVSSSLEHTGRFSRRTAWNRSPSELQEHLLLPGETLPLLDLTASNPTACGFALAAPDLLEPLQNEESLVYSPDAKGLSSAREAIVTYYAGHGAKISAEQIILTASTSESYSHLFRLLCEPGDEDLIAQPSYPLFTYLADLPDVTLRYYPLFYDHGWWIDTAELERAVSPRTRAIVVVHPNNPTGHLTPSAERDYLFDLCGRHGLTLIVDEVFLDFPHNEAVKLQSFAATTLPPLTFILSGLSKIAALPQVKIGWIVAMGPDLERCEALARLDLIADTFLSVNTPSQLAVPKWLAKASHMQQRILQRMRINCRALDTAELDIYAVEAGWSAIIRLPRIFRHETAFQSLHDAGILTHPAHFYGLHNADRVVLSLITPTEIMQEALGRVQGLLKEAHDVRVP